MQLFAYYHRTHFPKKFNTDDFLEIRSPTKFVLYHLNRLVLFLNRVYKLPFISSKFCIRKDLLDDIFLTHYWTTIEKAISKSRRIFTSEATISLVLGIWIGILLAVTVGIMMLCSGKISDGVFHELKFTPTTFRSKEKRKSCIQKSDSSESDRHGELLDLLNISELNKPESCDWWNLLLGQIILNYTQSPTFQEDSREFIENLLNGQSKTTKHIIKSQPTHEEISSPLIFTTIHVKEFNFDNPLPIFKNARIISSPSIGTQTYLLIYIDLSYQANVKLLLDCEIVLNWPKPSFATLPMALSILMTEICTTCIIKVEEHNLEISFLPETFRTVLEIKSSLGSRIPIKDLPKVKYLILAKIQNSLREHIIFPNCISIPFPFLGESRPSK
jgi:hypothetical protein